MRVTFVLLAILLISIGNATTNAVPPTRSTKMSRKLTKSIDTALNDSNNKASKPNLRGRIHSNDEERNLWDTVRKIFDIKAKNKIVPVSDDTLKAASKKVKPPPVLTALTYDQLTALTQGRTRDIFANWAQNKVLPEKVAPMLFALNKDDRNQVMSWYINDIYRRGNWNVRRV
ncbi:RxLR effector protein [Phytophthora megakarya]|uniref:RxLR effector protein n=1 Tax=Phytophthora megakarya TaxID=4795 RepID=A0A225V0A0_9STRA|nr:RxLR effector protein [Phytophthora megakarya]